MICNNPNVNLVCILVRTVLLKKFVLLVLIIIIEIKIVHANLDI